MDSSRFRDTYFQALSKYIFASSCKHSLIVACCFNNYPHARLQSDTYTGANPTQREIQERETDRPDINKHAAADFGAEGSRSVASGAGTNEPDRESSGAIRSEDAVSSGLFRDGSSEVAEVSDDIPDQ